MSDYPTLFSPVALGSATAKNRLVMAPMVRNYAREDGTATPRYRAHIASLARGGVGTLILEASYVQKDGRGFPEQLGIHHDGTVGPLRELVEAAHEHGALIGPQLYHAGRQTSSASTGTQPVAPSPIPDPLMGEVPRELTVDEIQGIVTAFGEAARRAEEAGCDFVEIHGAHGYLLTQFLSPFTNKRDDAYGGDFDRRLRLLLEVVAAAQQATSEDLPVLVRLSADEMVPGGLTLEETRRVARELEDAGVAALDVSAGNYASYTRGYMMAPMAREDGVLVDFADEVRQHSSLPVIGVGKVRTPELAEEVVSEGRADLVALGRSLLADPDWPRKAEAGQPDRIRHCIACNQGCVGRLFAGLDVWCTVNPACGFEEALAAPAPISPGHVLVVGGGPAGMQAALTAADRGHRVMLCERDEQLGGQLHAAAATPLRDGWEELRAHLVAELEHRDVEVRLGTEITREMVGELDPDAVVLATGSEQVRPSLPGIDDDRVITSRDLLEGRRTAVSPVIVAGGGCAGAQTAEQLAELGHEVTLVEQLSGVATDAPIDDRTLLLQRLEQAGVTLRTETTLMEVRSGQVVVEDLHGAHELPAETVVLCLGARPVDDLADALERDGHRVSVVGDAKEPRKVTEAIQEGARAAVAV